MAFCCCLLWLAFLLAASYSFNIDTKFPIFKEAVTADAYFGYSVAQHALSDGDTIFNSILVGAPLAESEDPVYRRHGKTGALYSCLVDVRASDNSNCKELTYPNTEETIDQLPTRQPGTYQENKTAMWLGVNIRSGGAGKYVVGCGHRYRIMEQEVNVYGLGMCFVYNGDLSPLDGRVSYTPCIGQRIIDSEASVSGAFGLCAAGMGLHVYERDIVYGLPGAVSWRGAISWDNIPDDPFAERTPYTQNERERFSDQYSYLGSSSVIANNLISPNKLAVAVGAPREQDVGHVFVFELQLNTIDRIAYRRNLTGEQFGSAFGHSLAAVDIRNKNQPSVLVGAPYYRSGDNKVGGAVYVFYNNGEGIANKATRLLPGDCPSGMDCENAQFGYSLTGVGDINGDSFSDVAVGAPYYGSGAVFIYNGLANGSLSTTPSQIIMATSLNTASLRRKSISGFGISLSGGHDMDQQGFADILVGAHRSSHVIVLRSRPVVTLSSRIVLDTTNIDPDVTTCPSRPSAAMACISLQICFKAVPSKTSTGNVSIRYTLTADASQEQPAARRVQFTPDANVQIQSVLTNVTVQALGAAERCIPLLAFIPRMRDILKPIQFDLSHSLVEPSNPSFSNIDGFPIMNEAAPLPRSQTIDFKKECKTPSCETDISVTMFFANDAVINDDKTGQDAFVFNSNQVDKLLLNLTITVIGNGDPAYEPYLYISLPSTLRNYGEPESTNAATSCSDNTQTNTVICNFGKKLNAGSIVTLTVKLDPGLLGATFSQINVTVNTTSKDSASTNDQATLKVRVVIVTDLELLGSASRGDQIKYGGEVKGASVMVRDNQIGSFVQHTYTLLNRGSGRVQKASVIVQWPYETMLSGMSKGKYLLYMTVRPQLNWTDVREGQCAVSNAYINSLNLEIIDEDKKVTSAPSEPQRRRREAGKTSAVRTVPTSDGVTRKVAMLNCRDETARCFNITCDFFELKPGAEVKIRLNARLWNSTLLEEYGQGSVSSVQITSQAFIHLDSTIDVVQTTITNDYANVTTVAEPDVKHDGKGEPVPIWIIIVSVCAGLLLLVVIIIIMWKCGFFKRHRPMTHEVKVEKSKARYQEVPQSDGPN